MPRLTTISCGAYRCIIVAPSIFGGHLASREPSSVCASARVATELPKSAGTKGTIDSSLSPEVTEPEAESGVSAPPAAKKVRVSFRLIWDLIDWGLLLVGVALTLCSVGIAVMVPARSAALLRAAAAGQLTARAVVQVLLTANMSAVLKMFGSYALLAVGDNLKRKLRAKLFSAVLEQARDPDAYLTLIYAPARAPCTRTVGLKPSPESNLHPGISSVPL